jgi:hypothetical protein
VQHHLFDIIYLILGVLFSMRQLEVSMRLATNYPNTTEADFDRWKRTAVLAYRTGAWTCFGKVLLDIVFAYGLRTVLPPMVLMTFGITLEIGAIVLVAYAIVRIRRSRVLAREFGIEALPRPRVEPSEP